MSDNDGSVNKVASGYKTTYRAMIFAVFLSTGIVGLLKFPRSVYMTDLGLSLTAYGVLVSLGYGLQFFFNGPAGTASDRSGRKKPILITMIILELLMHGLFIISDNLLMLSFAFVLQAISTGVSHSMSLVIMSNISARENEGRSFAFYKIGGSLGWMVFSLANGVLLTLLGYKPLFIFGAILCALKLYISIAFIKDPKIIRDSADKKIKPGLLKSVRKDVLMRIVAIYVLFLFTNLSHMGGFSYMQLYFKSELNISMMLSAWVLASSGFFEIPLSLVTSRLISMFRVNNVIIAGCFLGAARWFLLTLAQGPVLLFAVQFLHAIMVCIISIAMITYLSGLVPQELKGTTFGFFNSMGAAGCIFGPMLLGVFSDQYGIKTAMILNGILGLAGIVVFLIINYFTDRHFRIKGGAYV